MRFRARRERRERGRALLECRGVSVPRRDRRSCTASAASCAPANWWRCLGPNGAGKSTLLDALGGALAPAEGEIVATDASRPLSRP